MLIPANELDRAKGRLASLLTEGERIELFLATLSTVVEAALELWPTYVLTRDKRIPGHLPATVRILDEDTGLSGLNEQLEAAIPAVDAQQLLILHGDLPLASATALQELIDGTGESPAVGLVESRDGGTNAMLLKPPGAFALAYGPGSFARHRELAGEAGYAIHAHRGPLAIDLDTPDDCLALMRHPDGPQSRAGKYLTSIGFEGRAGGGR